MLATAKLLNLAVRFALELALLAAVAAAAWQAPSTTALRWVAALGAVLAVSAGWVVLVHGDGIAAPVRRAAQAVALAIGIGCTISLGAPDAAALLGVVALVNAALLAAWHQ